MTIYRLYAERGRGEYGQSEYGYYTFRGRAEQELSINKNEIQKRGDYTVSGYFDNDWKIEEIYVEANK